MTVEQLKTVCMDERDVKECLHTPEVIVSSGMPEHVSVRGEFAVYIVRVGGCDTCRQEAQEALELKVTEIEEVLTQIIGE